MNLKDHNSVSVPVFEYNLDGSIKPNPLFHRSWDKIHSRSVEYPYAASKLTNESRLLDVGTVKADKAWLDWLEGLPIEVHATDYDADDKGLFNRIRFVQSDVRKLPYTDNFFDSILAVSVIEHIGLNEAQVLAASKPTESETGDLEAVKELTRVLKPGGKLIMTLPFGVEEGLILNDEARNYTVSSITKFDKIIKNEELEYYEYQYRTKPNIFIEYPSSIDKRRLTNEKNEIMYIPRESGKVTWRRINIDKSSAFHIRHTEGVVCGVWKKKF